MRGERVFLSIVHEHGQSTIVHWMGEKTSLYLEEKSVGNRGGKGQKLRCQLGGRQVRQAVMGSRKSGGCIAGLAGLRVGGDGAQQ